jgi:hypothetical protein
MSGLRCRSVPAALWALCLAALWGAGAARPAEVRGALLRHLTASELPAMGAQLRLIRPTHGS